MQRTNFPLEINKVYIYLSIYLSIFVPTDKRPFNVRSWRINARFRCLCSKTRRGLLWRCEQELLVAGAAPFQMCWTDERELSLNYERILLAAKLEDVWMRSMNDYWVQNSTISNSFWCNPIQIFLEVEQKEYLHYTTKGYLLYAR